ncbi:hypothetical protein L6164_033318 [Bauhinia variegata]|uniref:Uncharacterized protein n=1 Tax=Bauhinia variegata TaxID=167791 RepID=A0ACB9KRJ4_BAUVA|nr:hypothetical protein L6164_033318 [Bauhinia variegata]
MLRNLRSRRRPCYGGFICAVIAAILLLLSVYILSIRPKGLSVSHPRFHGHLHRNSKTLRGVLYDSLVSDSDNEDISDTDDKIDALDDVEEQLEEDELGNIEPEDEDEPFDQNKVSGYFFDHVKGVIRRTINKRSIEEWNDGQVGSFLGSWMEDPIKAVFGSDDAPVDEQVRRKAIQVMGIEDALLLKMGKKVSPLREGWGEWFHKKADFLRKEKMLKPNLEILNPLNNPILQDPDGLGVTGLSKCDRIVRKSLLAEFKRVPFLGKRKAFCISRGESKENHDDAKDIECSKVKGNVIESLYK